MVRVQNAAVQAASARTLGLDRRFRRCSQGLFRLAWPLAWAALQFVAAETAPAPTGIDKQAAVLHNYLINNSLTASRGAWYDIVTWAARTRNCEQRPESVACMACSANLPPFAREAGVAPLGVGNDLWFNPERGATCGMCLQVYMVMKGLSNCSSPDTNPACGGTGNTSYFPFVSKDWAYGARLYWDEEKQMPYSIGMAVEWFDRNQSLSSAITYPVMGRRTEEFGTWPVRYRGTACPVSQNKLLFHFMDFSRPHPLNAQNETGWNATAVTVGKLPDNTTQSLCDNGFLHPCGVLTNSTNPLAHIKLQVAGARLPVTAVAVFSKGQWWQLGRSGDNYWQMVGRELGVRNWPEPADASVPMDVRVWCAGSQQALEQKGLVPGRCLCAYQDPDCQPCKGSVQCSAWGEGGKERVCSC